MKHILLVQKKHRCHQSTLEGGKSVHCITSHKQPFVKKNVHSAQLEHWIWMIFQHLCTQKSLLSILGITSLMTTSFSTDFIFFNDTCIIYIYIYMVWGHIYNNENDSYTYMGEKAIWLDIACVCGHIFTSHRLVKIQHKSFESFTDMYNAKQVRFKLSWLISGNRQTWCLLSGL